MRRDVVPAAPPSRAERATTSRSQLGKPRASAARGERRGDDPFASRFKPATRRRRRSSRAARRASSAKRRSGRRRSPKPTKWKVKTSAVVNPQLTVPRGYEKFLAPAGTVYVRSKHPPSKVFKDGFRRREGYDDIVRHTKVDQGFGSNWIATSKSPWIQEDYGAYLYEIQHDGTRGSTSTSPTRRSRRVATRTRSRRRSRSTSACRPEWIVAVGRRAPRRSRWAKTSGTRVRSTADPAMR